MSQTRPNPTSGMPSSAEKPHGVGEERGRARQPGETAPTRVVEFEHVSKTYNVGQANAFTAIQDITFAVEDLRDKGEFVCVLGPSGCGKSTILRLIAGLDPQHPPSQGTVSVMGQRVIGPGFDRGMVFQDYTSFDHLTVLENITFGLECNRIPRNERQALGQYWIHQVGMNVASDQHKYPHELSGGMRQRVAIARTLILRPRIILMDEPFGALDPQTRMNMQDLLISLWKSVHATVFFVTHSIEEAVFLGDRVFLLSRSPGRLLHQIELEPADRPAAEMQKEKRFADSVNSIRDMIALEEKPT